MRFRPYRVIRKPQALLLEVLFAFTLVLLCIIPLLSPHTSMLKQQTQLLQQTKLQHVVHSLYAEVLEKLYRNEIPWSTIEDHSTIAIEKEKLQTLPYNGFYFFDVPSHAKSSQEHPVAVYLIPLTFVFTNKQDELRYQYPITILRDTGETLASSSDDEEEEETLPSEAP